MKTIETNLAYIDASNQTNAGTKMALAMKEELRKYNYHIIDRNLLDTWLEELRHRQDELLTQHNWIPVDIWLSSLEHCDVQWLYIARECVARIVPLKGELTV